MVGTLSVGLVTLCGSFAVSRTMYLRVRRRLGGEDRARLSELNARFRLFAAAPLLMLLVYLLARVFAPNSRLLIIFALWALYNLFLVLKMRWLIAAFHEARLPPGFQLGYIFSRVIAYTGLVSSMLILFEGGYL